MIEVYSAYFTVCDTPAYSVLKVRIDPQIRDYHTVSNLVSHVLPKSTAVLLDRATVILADPLLDAPIETIWRRHNVSITYVRSELCTPDVMREVMRTLFINQAGYIRYYGFLLYPVAEGTPDKGIFLNLQTTESGMSLILDAVACPDREQSEQDFRVAGKERRANIHEARNKRAFQIGENYLVNFGLVISKNMVNVSGRRLSPPALEKDRYDKTLKNWCVLNLSNENPTEIDNFCLRLVNSCCAEMMGFVAHPAKELITITSDYTKRILQYLKDCCTIKVDFLFLFVALPDKKSERDLTHRLIKRQCEHSLGFASQCFRPKKVGTKETKNLTLQRLVRQINAKCGGTPQLLRDNVLGSTGLTMVLGADVTHFEDGTTPSISAFVASMDPGSSKYKALLSAQEPWVEIIPDIFTPPPLRDKGAPGGMMRDMLNAFKDQNNGRLPDRIIYYRDGVADKEFSRLLNQEGLGIKKACASIEDHYSPKLTVVVVQKRHKTRFFSSNTETGNIVPGTVIDKMVTRKGLFDFFLCNSKAVKGNTRVPHYAVIYDENNFTADEFQRITHCLCHLYCRSDNAVSLVPPVNYAHLAAARGREYIQAFMEENENGHSLTLVDARNLLHVESKIANTMFFT